MRVDILETAGTDQLCAGQTAGVEAAIHSIRDHFRNPEVEAVLLVDATNAFNSLNREVAIENAKHLCPTVATALFNFYCCPSELFCDKNILWSHSKGPLSNAVLRPIHPAAHQETALFGFPAASLVCRRCVGLRYFERHQTMVVSNCKGRPQFQVFCQSGQILDCG